MADMPAEALPHLAEMFGFWRDRGREVVAQGVAREVNALAMLEAALLLYSESLGPLGAAAHLEDTAKRLREAAADGAEAQRQADALRAAGAAG